MDTYLIDSNFFLRFLLNDNPTQYGLALKYLNLAKNGEIKLVLSSITVAEMIYVLERLYELDRRTIVQKIAIIINTPYIDIQDRDYIKQALLTFLHEKIHFSDCYLLERAMCSDYKILTFDKDLMKLYTKVDEK